MKFSKSLYFFLFCTFISTFCSVVHAQSLTASEWATYGGDAGGRRYSGARQITPENVSQLKPAWEYHTGALASKRLGYHSASFEATPVLFHGNLYFTTPFDEIVAVDAVTGQKRWSYDPNVIFGEGNLITSRGVAIWEGPAGNTGPCHDRVLAGTLRASLIAVDGADGKPCSDFGKNGEVFLIQNSNTDPSEILTVTSPPTIVGNIVVVGSSIADNYGVTMERGSVRAFSVLSGKLAWKWDPIPWAEKQRNRSGAANAWSVISADPALGLIYIPTGSPSPDYFGGLRPGDNADADSVVAVEASTGKKVWAFQLVHHDLWDYDTAAQPLLFTFHENIPAIAVTNKTGMVYVLDRRTGAPLYPVKEKAVPASDVPGEHASPTQPFSSLPPLGPLWVAGENIECQQKFAGLRYGGVFTPPSIRGSLEFPGKLGGVNWGSAAFDPETGIYYAATNRLPFEVRLVPRANVRISSWLWWQQHTSLPFRLRPLTVVAISMALLGFLGGLAWRPFLYLAGAGALLMCLIALQWGLRRVVLGQQEYRALHTILGVDDSPMIQTPYALYLRPITDHAGLPCSPRPWGAVTALNLQTGERVWESPLGTMKQGEHTGTLELGGPIVTAGGLVFSAGTRDPYLRAFNKVNGEELWKGRLPVPAQATPMTFSVHGRQFVVIAAGGHGMFNTPQGDSLIAFALPN